jgi:hypothetical protein
MTQTRRRRDDPAPPAPAPVTVHPDEVLDGARLRAVHRLSDAADHTLAEVGATCERVPVDSLGPLLEAGHIELVQTKEP